MVGAAQKEVLEVEKQYLDGAITNGERYNKVISIWSAVTEKVADAMFKEMEQQDKEGIEFNPIYIMADSGARGSKQQIRQLAGMRGLMAKPSGEIIENPITSNFREGLTVLQYFVSTHGARKGLADTALKTADSGYLTRRLVDVSQDVIITEHDCGTVDGIEIRPIIESGEVIEPLRDRIIGRVSLEKIKDPIDGTVIVKANQEITEEIASAIQAAGIEKVRIRSVLSCESARGVCALCYGRDLATGKLVEMGLAVGVIAAQSIGEPGTQLTMRTFHIGGTASHTTQQTTLEAKNAGLVKFHNVTTVKDKKGDLVVMNRSGALIIHDQKGREQERHAVVYGARLKVKDGGEVKPGPAHRRVGPVLVHDHDRGQRRSPTSRTSSTARPCTSRSTRTPACRRSSSSSRPTRRSSRASRSGTRRARSSASTSCPRARTSWSRTARRSRPATCSPRSRARPRRRRTSRAACRASWSSSRRGGRRSRRSSPRSTAASSTATCRSSTARSS